MPVLGAGASRALIGVECRRRLGPATPESGLFIGVLDCGVLAVPVVFHLWVLLGRHTPWTTPAREPFRHAASPTITGGFVAWCINLGYSRPGDNAPGSFGGRNGLFPISSTSLSDALASYAAIAARDSDENPAKHDPHFAVKRSIANIGVVMGQRTHLFYQPPRGAS